MMTLSHFFDKRIAIGVGIGLCLPYIARWFEKYLFGVDDYDFEEINETLFFNRSGNSCRSHFQKENIKRSCDSPNCSFYNLSQMLQYLKKAKKSLDICLYLITVKDLGEAIVQAYKRGVKVRVITDEDMANGSGSQIISFRGVGIPVRNELNSKVLMHNKWVIIDEEIVMTGSLNWTMQAFCGNYENLLVTNQPHIVAGYRCEFHRLWTSLK